MLWPRVAETDWLSLPVRKSRIQLQRELLRPSRFSLLMSFCGIIVLNAELKSMTCSLKEESLFSKLVRARWRVEEIASSVEWFERFANWSGSESCILSDQDGGTFGRSGYITKSSDFVQRVQFTKRTFNVCEWGNVHSDNGREVPQQIERSTHLHLCI